MKNYFAEYRLLRANGFTAAQADNILSENYSKERQQKQQKKKTSSSEVLQALLPIVYSQLNTSLKF
jgi:hypothetical protein